jgi:ArsR family transcriptional regulator
MRLQILDVLCSRDECVCHLSAELDKPQPYVSQQLAILRNGGVIGDYKEGTNVFYRLAGDSTREQVAAVLAGVESENSSGIDPGRTVVAGCCCPRCNGGI